MGRGYDGRTGDLLAGTNWLAELYWAVGSNRPALSLAPIGLALPFGTGAAAGLFDFGADPALGIRIVPGVQVGDWVTLQVRVWNAAAGGSYEQAAAIAENRVHQPMETMATQDETGNVAVSWYDCREDPNNERADYWAAVSRDEFQTAPANFPLNWLSSDARGPSNVSPYDLAHGYFDYTGLAYDEGWLYPIWQDNSNSTGDNPDGDCCNNALDICVARIAY
jgi:hypothetical protein